MVTRIRSKNTETLARDMEPAISVPDLVPEFCQLLLVFWIENEFRFELNDHSRIESSTTEHHCRLDMGVPVENTL